jgi:MFS family permease
VPASVAGFIVARAILALGEAGNFPAAIKATAEYFPKTERSFATGIFNSGANIGAILAPITVPVIASIWGWEAAFMWIGAIGFLWMAFWGGYYEEPGAAGAWARPNWPTSTTTPRRRGACVDRKRARPPGASCCAAARPGPSPSANS